MADARRTAQLFLVAIFVLQHWNKVCSNEMLVAIFTNLPIIGPMFSHSRFELINGNWCANPDISHGYQVWLRDELKVFIASWVVVDLIFGSALGQLLAGVPRKLGLAIFFFHAYLTRFCIELGSLVLFSNLFETSRLDQFMMAVLSFVAFRIFLKVPAMRCICYFFFLLFYVFKIPAYGFILFLIVAYYFRPTLSLPPDNDTSSGNSTSFKTFCILPLQVISIFIASFAPPRFYSEVFKIIFQIPIINSWHFISDLSSSAWHFFESGVSGAWLSISNLVFMLMSPLLNSMSMPVYAAMSTLTCGVIIIVVYRLTKELWRRIATQCPQIEGNGQKSSQSGILNSFCSAIFVWRDQLQQALMSNLNFFEFLTSIGSCLSKSTFVEFVTGISLFLVAINILKVLIASFVPSPALLVTRAFDIVFTLIIMKCVLDRFGIDVKVVSAFVSSTCDNVISFMKGSSSSNQTSKAKTAVVENVANQHTHIVLTVLITFLMIWNCLFHAPHDIPSLSESSTSFIDLIFQYFSDSYESTLTVAWSVCLRFSPLFRLFKLVMSQFPLIFEDDTRLTPAQVFIQEFDTCYIIDFNGSNHDTARLDFSPAYGNATMFFQPIKNHPSVGAFVIEINGSAVPALDLKPIKGLLDQSLSLCFSEAEQPSSIKTQMYLVSSFVFRRFHRVVLELPLPTTMVFNRSVVPWVRATEWKATVYSQAALLPGQTPQDQPSCDSHKCRPVGRDAADDDGDECWWWWWWWWWWWC